MMIRLYSKLDITSFPPFLYPSLTFISSPHLRVLVFPRLNAFIFIVNMLAVHCQFPRTVYHLCIIISFTLLPLSLLVTSFLRGF